MNFISLVYFFFIGITLIFYWRSQSQQQKLRVMVIASLLFYALFYKDRPPLLLILNLALLGAIIYVNFWIGKLLLESQIIEYRVIQDNLLDRQQSPFLPRTKVERQRVLLIGIVFNILLLLASKYIPFFLTTISSLGLPQVQATANWYRSTILPPLGISFLTFESIAYLVDVTKAVRPRAIY
jgi:alginate O-acetyltransferase complex protein AlgI